MLVPSGWAAGWTCTAISRPSQHACQACSCAAGLDVNVRRLTAEILASASPRKPNESICSRSSSVDILLVACRDSASSSSCFAMPLPLSRSLMRLCPPFSISSSMRFAPASKLFSTSSFTTEAGRSTTSPAAIWLASRGGNS